MNIRVALIIAFCCAPVAAVAQGAPVDDEQVFQAGGKTWLLRSHVQDAVFAAPALQTHLRRIGLAETCALAGAAVREAVADGSNAFRPVLVATMRSQIPAERFSAPGWRSLQGNLTPYRARVLEAMGRDAAPVYARADALALAHFAHAASAAAPLAGGNWAGIFADWDLSRANAVRVACTLAPLQDPAQQKSVFDQFYQRKELH